MSDKSIYKPIKTDTAGVLFSCYHHKNTARILRMGVVLRYEEVNPEILKKAVKMTVPRFPVLNRRYRRGIFNGYLEYANVMPTVAEESEIPAYPQWFGKHGGPEFRVLYYKRRITVEMAHVITDGTGAYEFLMAVAAQYLLLCGMNKSGCEGIKVADSTPDESESENSYKRFYTKEKSKEAAKKPKVTYNISGVLEKDCLIHTQGYVKVSELKQLAATYKMTVTQYLTAIMIFACIKSADKPISEPIRVEIPVNLRRFFKTDTLRNFSASYPIEFFPNGRSDITFEECCTAVCGQLEKYLTKENLQLFINSSHALATNPAVRILPYFVMGPGLRQLQKSNLKKCSTVKMSNLGNKVLPEEMQKRIERIDFLGGDSYLYGQAKFCTVIGYDGYLCFCFARCDRSTALEKAFFTIMSEHGVFVRVDTTDPECFSETEKTENLKYCKHCNIYAQENGVLCPLCAQKLTTSNVKDDNFKLAQYPKHQALPTEKKSTHKLPSMQSVKAFFSI